MHGSPHIGDLASYLKEYVQPKTNVEQWLEENTDYEKKYYDELFELHPELMEPGGWALSGLPPLKQLEAGIPPKDVRCADGLVLMRTPTDGPACLRHRRDITRIGAARMGHP